MVLRESQDELKAAQTELFEKFGELPKEVINLLDLLKLKLAALETQKITSIITHNIASSGSKTPEYIINITLTSALKDKNVLKALHNAGVQITDNTIKLPLTAVGNNWIEGIKKIIKLIK